MRPTNHTTTSTTINVWNSPIPYLFGSLAVVLMLIAVALILLVCSFKKQSSSLSSNSGSDENASEKPAIILKVVDPEPKIVVIMAGDEKPSFLAMPAVSSTICRCDYQV
ncbi:hypothetical protein Ddye_001717 [Dipteronia dyeriana]|uniref:Uncharacterized protein n=1 Tax=Dipteronia dyeriana TaxID=168575 RepID=A0AAD9XQD8_9ROSI|nr:hypothetical protein Ddye_001717 [Dipteronia dyeriana]